VKRIAAVLSWQSPATGCPSRLCSHQTTGTASEGLHPEPFVSVNMYPGFSAQLALREICRHQSTVGFLIRKLLDPFSDRFVRIVQDLRIISAFGKPPLPFLNEAYAKSVTAVALIESSSSLAF
jgi:hypothetical protein